MVSGDELTEHDKKHLDDQVLLPENTTNQWKKTKQMLMQGCIDRITAVTVWKCAITTGLKPGHGKQLPNTEFTWMVFH